MNMSEFLTPGVIWFLIGLGLLILELIIPGLIVIFFGVGAWITALCCVLFNPGLNGQLLIFVVTSVLGLLLLRKFLKHKFFGADLSESDALEDEFIGKTARLETAMQAGVPGKISFKGTRWTAIAESDIEAGSQVEITGKESLTLFVKKK